MPLLLEGDQELTLAGHVARANPIWNSFNGEAEALAIFNGPHAYLSPKIYASEPNVPTWNYVAVHAAGHPCLLDEEQALAHVKLMLDFLDPSLKATHPQGLEESYLRARINGIVAFEMKIERLEGKAKLSQNKSEADRQSAASALEADEKSKLLADWMKRS